MAELTLDRTQRTQGPAPAPRWAATAKRTGRVAALASVLGVGAIAVATGAPALMLAAGFVAAGVDALVRGQAVRGRFRRLPLQREIGPLLTGSKPVGVRVRGKVRCTETLTSLLTGRPAVLRRLELRVESPRFEPVHTVVHEAGYDFELEDARGARITVCLAGAELFGRQKVMELVNQPGVRGRLATEMAVDAQCELYAAEHLVVDGQEIEVVGTRTRAVDRDGEAVGRESAWRTVIATGKAPVVVFV